MLGGEGLGCLHLDLHLRVDLVDGLGACWLLVLSLILLKDIHSDLGCPNERINQRESSYNVFLSATLGSCGPLGSTNSE